FLLDRVTLLGRILLLRRRLVLRGRRRRLVSRRQSVGDGDQGEGAESGGDPGVQILHGCLLGSVRTVRGGTGGGIPSPAAPVRRQDRNRERVARRNGVKGGRPGGRAPSRGVGTRRLARGRGRGRVGLRSPCGGAGYHRPVTTILLPCLLAAAGGFAPGPWRATLASPLGELPFSLSVEARGDGTVA